MKILQIHNEYKYRGGEDIVVEEEKKILLKNNCKVFQLIKKNINEITSIYKIINIVKNLNYSIISKNEVLDNLDRIKPDLVHIHNTFPLWSYSVIDACNEKKIPVVMTLHNFRMICANGTFYRNNQVCEKCLQSSVFNSVKYGCYQNSKLKSIPVSLMINNSNKGLSIVNKLNKIIVLSEFAKKKFLEANFPKNKIVIKPNFIFDKIKCKKNISKSGFLYASRLSEEKGILDLIKAFKKFNFDLNVCGDGPLKSKLENETKIKYLGFLSKKKLLNLLMKTKFLIFPSKCFENFPTIFLQAFALNVLVIAPKLGSMSTIIKDKHNGVLFKANDVDDMIKKIKWVMSNDDKCNQIIKNAKKDLKKKYTESINYKILMDIYEKTIKENKNN